MNQNQPLYQTNYLGFYVKVYPDHVEFRSSMGAQSLPIGQIVSVQTGTIGMMQVTFITSDGQSFAVPTMKKKEVEQAVLQAQARFAASNPPQSAPVASQQSIPPVQPIQGYGQPMMQTASQVKTYKSAKEFQRDQKRMVRQGWVVQNTMSHQPRRSIAGLLLVPFAMYRPPKPAIIVTYQKQSWLAGQ